MIQRLHSIKTAPFLQFFTLMNPIIFHLSLVSSFLLLSIIFPLLLFMFFYFSFLWSFNHLYLLRCLLFILSIFYILSLFFTAHLLHVSWICINPKENLDQQTKTLLESCDPMRFVHVFTPIDPNWWTIRMFLLPFFNWPWQCTMANLWLRSIWQWQTRARRVWICLTFANVIGISASAAYQWTVSIMRAMHVGLQCSRY